MELENEVFMKPVTQARKLTSSEHDMLAQSRMKVREALNRACKDRQQQQRQQQQQMKMMQVKTAPKQRQRQHSQVLQVTSKLQAAKNNNNKNSNNKNSNNKNINKENNKNNNKNNNISSSRSNKNIKLSVATATAKRLPPPPPPRSRSGQRRTRKSQLEVRPQHKGDEVEFISYNPPKKRQRKNAKVIKMPGEPTKQTTASQLQLKEPPTEQTTEPQLQLKEPPTEQTTEPQLELKESPPDKRVLLSEYSQEEFLGLFGVYTHDVAKRLSQRPAKRKRLVAQNKFYGNQGTVKRSKTLKSQAGKQQANGQSDGPPVKVPINKHIL